MSRPEHVIEAYLEGTLTTEQARVLEAWINADTANAKAFLHLIQTHQSLGVIGKENKLTKEAAQAESQQLDNVTLASLAQMEAQSEPLPFEALDQPSSIDEYRRDKRASEDPGLAQSLDDLRWAAGKFFGRLIRSPYGIGAGVAALLVFGLLLLAPWKGEAPPNDPSITEQQAEPDPSGVALNAIVATLTAERDAVWTTPQASASSAPVSPLTQGSPLRANQRLTLTAGFAEITTHRGAVAILEAPATIELLDNDNAMRLHAGKLVGICETESSKGFLVRTPHLDITDLGTRFGVDMTRSDTTELHVFDGLIEITHSALSQAHRLRSGQSASLTTTGDGLVTIPQNTAGFAAVRPDGSLDQAIWTGEVPGYLDVVDLVAGGDGTGTRDQVGLDPITGGFVSADTPGLWGDRFGDGQFKVVNESTYIAGTFIPKNDGSVAVKSAGVVLPPIPPNRAMFYGAIWCGGTYPQTTEHTYTAVINGTDYAKGLNRALYLHTSCGVTLDLQAIRAAYPEHRVTRFVATANNTVLPNQVGQPRKSQIIIGLDDVAALEHRFVVTPTEGSEPFAIDIPIDQANHLSLITTDGGDGIVLDRIVLGNPRLILEPRNE